VATDETSAYIPAVIRNLNGLLRLLYLVSEGRESMDGGLRAPLIVVELAVLAAILAFIDEPIPRVALGLVVGLLLAWSALTAGKISGVAGAPEGYDDRRTDHLFRHWINVLLKRIREFHAICQGVTSGGVNFAVGQLRINEIEKEIRDLLAQVTENAMPADMRKERRARPPAKSRKKMEAYGESVEKD
jgi:hypothetical protein